MLESGLRPNQVKQVRGFSDQQLRMPKDPDDASNRRISVIVRYLRPPPPAPGEEKKGEAKPAHGEAKPAEHKEAAAPAKGH